MVSRSQPEGPGKVYLLYLGRLNLRRLTKRSQTSQASSRLSRLIVGTTAQNQPEQRPYRCESNLAREDFRHEKSSIVPIAVANKTIPEPLSGTL